MPGVPGLDGRGRMRRGVPSNVLAAHVPSAAGREGVEVAWRAGVPAAGAAVAFCSSSCAAFCESIAIMR